MLATSRRIRCVESSGPQNSAIRSLVVKHDALLSKPLHDTRQFHASPRDRRVSSLHVPRQQGRHVWYTNEASPRRYHANEHRRVEGDRRIVSHVNARFHGHLRLEDPGKRRLTAYRVLSN
jgi:hypothetical protein